MNISELDHQSGGPRAAIIGNGQLRGVGPGPVITAADTPNGNSVLGPSGERLDEIDHTMLDVPRGQIAYAVPSFGGSLGVGTKLLAVLWSALTLDTVRKCFVPGIGKKQLEAVPGFDQDHWLSMADMQWATSIHRHYGSPPYWEGSRNEVKLDS